MGRRLKTKYESTVLFDVSIGDWSRWRSRDGEKGIIGLQRCVRCRESVRSVAKNCRFHTDSELLMNSPQKAPVSIWRGLLDEICFPHTYSTVKQKYIETIFWASELPKDKQSHLRAWKSTFWRWFSKEWAPLSYTYTLQKADHKTTSISRP